jgi:hypothetical protein
MCANLAKLAFTVALPSTICFGPAFADAIPLREYLQSMDHTEVSFSGLIGYEKRRDNFMYFDENKNAFGVTVDAGRAVREKIQTQCELSSISASYSDFCKISGSGSIEMRGANIHISISAVELLEKQSAP